MTRRAVVVLVAVITATSLIWMGLAVYAGSRFLDMFHVGLTSCLPADFPSYPGARVSSLVISDSSGDCAVQFQTRDAGDAVKAFFLANLEQDDWTITGVEDRTDQIFFERVSDANTTGYVQVIAFIPRQTQFQVDIETR
jgi:hypothetical protein